MIRTRKFPALLVAAAGTLILFGCTKNNPMSPESQEPPPVEIKTPISAIVTSIAVTKFPAKKSDGSDWDLSLFATSRRPDLYVILTADGQAADYTSNVVTDAVSGTVYTFTKPYSAYDGTLPAHLPYDSSRRTYVMDSDVGGDPDRLGWITVNLPTAYKGDNARNLDYTFTDSGNRLSVRIRGTWNY